MSAPQHEIVDMETGEIVPYEAGTSMSLFGTLDPDRALAEAVRYAKALAQVVDQQRMFATIGGKKHITVEGWQTLGSMTGVYAVGEGEPEPVEINGVAGFKATAVAMRNGEIIGRATAYCMRDEQRWKDQPTYAVASMAQTRAVSKALKGPLGFIVKLAGYSATPAEEMPTDAPPAPARTRPTPDPVAVMEKNDARNRDLKSAKAIERKLIAAGLTEAQFKAGVKADYGTEHVSELTDEQLHELVLKLRAAERAIAA